MLLDRLLRPLWHSTLLYSTASDLVRLQSCSHWCHQSLHDPANAEHLLRLYFNLSKQQLAKLEQSASLTLQRLLLPLASLERQLGGQSPPALHRALLIHAVCASKLTVTDLAQPHPSPVPAAPLPHTASWLPIAPFWELLDYCSLPDPRELTLGFVGLDRLQLWFHAPFWRKGWADYLYHWAHCASGTYDSQLHVSERDSICQKLDSRIHWIGCTQPDPNTILAIGHYYGHIRRCVHRVPDTFSRPGYDMRFAYSATKSEQCQQLMARQTAASMPVVTFELSGSMETVNGHQLHVYDSLGAFLLSQADKVDAEVRQQVQQFVQQVEGTGMEKDAEGVEEVDERAETAESVEKQSAVTEELKGMPLYLSCFPMPDSILWNS